MRALLLRSLLPALALSLAATACNKPPTTCDGGPTVSFLIPANGQTLDTTTNPGNVNLDAGTLGTQVEVQTFCVAVGSPVTISLDGTPLDGGSLLTIAGGTATVPGIVNLTGSYAGIAHRFGAKVVDSGGKGTALATSDVTVVLPPPLEQLSFVRPVSGVLNVFQDIDQSAPGFQTQVNFSQKASAGSTINLCSTIAPDSGAAACPFGASGAFFVDSISASDDMSLKTVTLGEGPQTLTASVVDKLSDAGATAAPVSIEVRSTRPALTSFTISGAFADDAGRLWLNSSNAADGGNAQASAVVVFGPQDTAIGDGGVQIFNAQTNALLASAPWSGGTTATVPISLGDGIYSLGVNAMDVWGNPVSNPNLIPVTTSPGVDTRTLGVKTSLATCQIVGPTGYWNVLKNDGGPANGSVTLPIQVTTTNAGATDLTSQPIPGSATISVVGGGSTSQPVTSPNFTADVTAPQGVASMAASISDPAGNPPQTCSKSVTVDTLPPTITVTPTNADSVVAGIQTYTSSNNVPVSIVTDAPAGQQISISVASGAGAPNLWNVATVASGGPTLVTLPALPQGLSAITAQVSDLAGNGVTSAPAQVSVAAPGFCSVYISYPPSNQVIGSGSGADAGSNAVTVSFTVQTLDAACFGDSVTFTLTPNGGSPNVTTLALDSTGKAIFPTTVADGETGTYVATIGDGHASTTPTFSYAVKLGTPTITPGGISPNAASVEIVAATGNPTVGGTTDGGALVVANAAADTANAHATFTLSVSGLGPLVSGNYGTATLHLSFPSAATNDPPPITIPTEPATVSFLDVLLPAHAAGGTVTLTVNDNAQNQVAYQWLVSTDVIPPGPPLVTTQVKDSHLATIALTWNATGDDGAAGGPVAGYDLRWSTTLNPANDDQFFDGGMTQTDTKLPGNPIGTAESYTLTVPPLNNYFVALRAVDAVGNRSTLAPTTVPNPWKTTTLTAPAVSGSTAFGFRVESGDFNGDQISDLVISDPYYGGAGSGDTINGGLVYVLPGQAISDLTQLKISDAAVLSTGAISDRFGYDLAVGDFNNDGTDDLAVGAYAINGSQGLVNIYFGGPNGIANAASPSVSITGATGATNQFGRTVKVLKGVPTRGQGDALFVGEPGTPGGSSNPGAGYVFFPKKQWSSSATSANADVKINGTAGETFGFRWGAVGVGDINGDNKNDCILPATAGGTVYAFSGATLAGAGSTALSTSTVADLLFSKTGPMPFVDGTTGYWDAFGTSAASAFFTNAATQDVAIGDAFHNTVSLFSTAATGLTQVTTLVSTGRFGWVLANADVNGDGSPDLLVGTNDTSIGAVSIFLNTKAAPFFGQKPDAVLSDTNPSFLGFSVTTGLFGGATNGLDIASGTANTTVLIYFAP